MRHTKVIFLIPVMHVFLCCEGTAQESDLDRGLRVYQRECIVCHSPGNRFYDALKEKYKDSVYIPVGERADFDPDEIKTIVRSWGARMPAFRPTEVTDEELDAVAQYLARNRNK